MEDEIIDLQKEQIKSYLEELKRCDKADCDYYLEHTEASELLHYITNLQAEIQELKEKYK